MLRLEEITVIRAPIERSFSLARSVEVISPEIYIAWSPPLPRLGSDPDW